MLIVAGVWAGGADGSARARRGSRKAAGGILYLNNLKVDKSKKKLLRGKTTGKRWM